MKSIVRASETGGKMNVYMNKGRYGERINIKKLVLYYLPLIFLLFLGAVAETSGLKMFRASPALTFMFVCAIGFVFGERSGAIFGIIGGVFIDALGFSGFLISPVLYMLSGYLCGRLVGWFLSKNLPSFMVYGLIAGAVKGIFTLFVIGVVSTEFDLLHILSKITVPEYFATVLCIFPVYLISAGIYRIFRGKDKKEFRF
ncbi:MAG: hypothetical protein IKA62_01035 [Clostridia bacterium]|nr:hypothetical protein [Clostridia bacterium]